MHQCRHLSGSTSIIYAVVAAAEILISLFIQRAIVLSDIPDQFLRSRRDRPRHFFPVTEIKSSQFIFILVKIISKKEHRPLQDAVIKHNRRIICNQEIGHQKQFRKIAALVKVVHKSLVRRPVRRIHNEIVVLNDHNVFVPQVLRRSCKRTRI